MRLDNGGKLAKMVLGFWSSRGVCVGLTSNCNHGESGYRMDLVIFPRVL